MMPKPILAQRSIVKQATFDGRRAKTTRYRLLSSPVETGDQTLPVLHQSVITRHGSGS
jgi:hypothetical protein